MSTLPAAQMGEVDNRCALLLELSGKQTVIPLRRRVQPRDWGAACISRHRARLGCSEFATLPHCTRLQDIAEARPHELAATFPVLLTRFAPKTSMLGSELAFCASLTLLPGSESALCVIG